MEQENYFEAKNQPPIKYPQESKRLLAGLFGIFLGSFGIHKFYLGYTQEGLIMLLTTVISCGLLIPLTHTIGLIEGIVYLAKSDEDFIRTYQIDGKRWF